MAEHHLQIIRRLSFRAAKTMPEIPHEYCTRKNSDPADYEALFRAIHADGIKERYNGRMRPYLYPGDGWKYWAMTSHFPSSHVLNRQRIEADAERLRREGEPVRDAHGRLITSRTG